MERYREPNCRILWGCVYAAQIHNISIKNYVIHFDCYPWKYSMMKKRHIHARRHLHAPLVDMRKTLHATLVDMRMIMIHLLVHRDADDPPNEQAIPQKHLALITVPIFTLICWEMKQGGSSMMEKS